MRERPIQFIDAMVRAILDGRKTQTRRVIKHSHVYRAYHEKCTSEEIRAHNRAMQRPLDIRAEQRGDLIPLLVKHCPYGVPGDRLWVRETWRIGAWDEDGARVAIDYRANGHCRREWLQTPDTFDFHKLWIQCTNDAHQAGKVPDDWGRYHWEPGQSPCRWRPSIHMPRWASRILLEVTDVRVQRVQEISREDAIAEGCPNDLDGGAHCVDGMRSECVWFMDLWDRLNAKRGHGWDVNSWVWAISFRRIDNDNR